MATAIALGGCNSQGAQSLSAAAPRGATVAFESIDGPPRAQFDKLVQNLNDEAQTRRLAVISRTGSSAYRVRGYLAAEVVKGRKTDTTTISWVWDVFDGSQQRALRISGAEVATGRHSDAWQLADDAMLRRIANSSMEKLAAFLTSPEVAPGTSAPAEGPLVASTETAASSPEARGIFRIFRPQADPASGKEPPTEQAVPAPAAKPITLAASGKPGH